MRKTCVLVENVVYDLVQRIADSRSCPNGFSMTRARRLRNPIASTAPAPCRTGSAGSPGSASGVARPQLLAHLLEGRDVAVVAIHIAQQRHQACQSLPDPARRASLRCPRARFFGSSSVHPDFATPITGPVSLSVLASRCSDGKICLYARSPVAPKNTRASDISVIKSALLKVLCKVDARRLAKKQRLMNAQRISGAQPAQEKSGNHPPDRRANNRHPRIAPVGTAFRDRQHGVCQPWTQISRRVDRIPGRSAQRKPNAPHQGAHQPGANPAPRLGSIPAWN